MKKILTLLFSAFLTMMLVMSVVPFKTMAADDTYTIRVFAGEQGTINGSEVYVEEVAYGDTFSFNINDVDISGTVDEDGQVKYYATGIHESGKEGNVYPSFTVTGDRDLVVTYGLASGLVQYTVHFMYGTTELGSDSFYAHDGEFAIAAAQYFDGYIPTYRNIGGTVVKGQANDWYLQYTAATVATTAEETTTVAAAAAAANDQAAAAANDQAANDQAGGDQTGDNGGADVTEPTAAPGGENETTTTPGGGNENPEPETEPDTDITIVTEPTTEPPLTNPETTTPGGNGGIGTWGTVGIVAGGVVVAGGIVAIIVAATKRKKL